VSGGGHVNSYLRFAAATRLASAARRNMVSSRAIVIYIATTIDFSEACQISANCCERWRAKLVSTGTTTSKGDPERIYCQERGRHFDRFETEAGLGSDGSGRAWSRAVSASVQVADGACSHARAC